MDEIPSNFPEHGKIEKKHLFLIIIAPHQANPQDHFRHNPWVIDHRRQVKKALRSGSQAINWCVSLPVQYQGQSYDFGLHVQDGALHLQGPEAGQAGSNPLSSVVAEP